MNISEKIRLSACHAANKGVACNAPAAKNAIHLFKEGVFWVAYEQSAYAVWRQKKYKPTKKYIKTVGKEVVSVGFPDSALNGIVETRLIASLQQRTDTMIVFETNEKIDEEAFLEWKNGIALPVAETRLIASLQTPAEISIVEKIKNFDLSNATPMECMMFLNGIKNNS